MGRSAAHKGRRYTRFTMPKTPTPKGCVYLLGRLCDPFGVE